jgi:hypothetical protein
LPGQELFHYADGDDKAHAVASRTAATQAALKREVACTPSPSRVDSSHSDCQASPPVPVCTPGRRSSSSTSPRQFRLRRRTQEREKPHVRPGQPSALGSRTR